MYTLPNISIKTNSNFKFTICFIIYLVSNKSTFEYPYQYKNIKLCSTYQTKKKNAYFRSFISFIDHQLIGCE